MRASCHCGLDESRTLSVHPYQLLRCALQNHAERVYSLRSSGKRMKLIEGRYGMKELADEKHPIRALYAIFRNCRSEVTLLPLNSPRKGRRQSVQSMNFDGCETTLGMAMGIYLRDVTASPFECNPWIRVACRPVLRTLMAAHECLKSREDPSCALQHPSRPMSIVLQWDS